MYTTCVLAGSNAGTVQVSWTTREPATSSAGRPAPDAGQRRQGNRNRPPASTAAEADAVGDGQRHRHRSADRGDEQERAVHRPPPPPRSPPSHPHHGIVRDGHRTGSVRRRASSATSSTEIVSAATRKLTSATATGWCRAVRSCALSAPCTGRAARRRHQRQPARRDGDHRGRRRCPAGEHGGALPALTITVIPASTASEPIDGSRIERVPGYAEQAERVERSRGEHLPGHEQPTRRGAPTRENSRMPLVM